MIDIRKLKELVRLMVANDLTELDLGDSEEQVSLRRQSPHGPPQLVHHNAVAPAPAVAVLDAPALSTVTAPADGAVGETGGDDEAGLVKIESPMVGTFYAAVNPESPPFVKPGDQVTAESVVCIIEAMKIFNEIKAETTGTIRRVLVKNGEPVEFGQPLFMVKPD